MQKFTSIYLIISIAPPKPKQGLAPPVLNDDIHTVRCLAQLRSKEIPLEKYIYLSALKHENPDMFYKLCLNNMAEFTPIIYTPVVGEACQKWSAIYRRPEGMVRISLVYGVHCLIYLLP